MNWEMYLDATIQSVISLLRPTWPQLVLLLSFILIWKFRTELSSLLSRIVRAGTGGFEFAAPQTPTRPVRGTDLPEERIGESAILIAQEEAIKRDLQTNFANKSDEERQNLLIKQLAVFQLVAWCEREFRTIFGSQIQMLKQLNLARQTGIPNEQIREMYSDATKRFPEFYKEGPDFDRYANYLVQTGTVVFTDGRYYITELGIEFLAWMNKAAIYDDRRF